MHPKWLTYNGRTQMCGVWHTTNQHLQTASTFSQHRSGNGITPIHVHTGLHVEQYKHMY